MSGWLKRSAFKRFLRDKAVVALPFALAACASDGARYAPPPPWSTAQQQYNQTYSQRPPVAGPSSGWQGVQSQPAWQPQQAPSWQPQPGNDVTGSIAPQQTAPTVYAQPLPPVTRSAPPQPAPQAQWTPPAAPPQWTPPSGPVRQPQIADSGQFMTVESGQTIAGISRKYGVRSQDLMQLNGITASDQLVIGQRLKLPKGAQVQAPLAWTQPAALPQRTRPATHTVRAGETLTSIATQYGMDASTIARFNNLGPSDRPQIGQKLELAANARPPVSAAPGISENLPTATIVPRLPEPKAVPAVVEQRKTVIATPAPEPAAVPAPQNADDVDFRWPVRGRVIAKFGRQENGGNVDGIKIAVPQGTPVRAAEAGTVVYSGSELKPYGNLILIRHAGGWVTAYAHNADLEVRNGDQVKRGQVIARAGQTGSVTQPQVHFEIRKGKTPVDPMEHLTGG